MKISKLILELERVRNEEGDIEVTCTGTTIPDDGWNAYETTVETLIIKTEPVGNLTEKRVRLYL